MSSQQIPAEFDVGVAALLFGKGIVQATLTIDAGLRPHLPFNKMSFVCSGSAGDNWVAFELKWKPMGIIPICGFGPSQVPSEIAILAERASNADLEARLSELGSVWNENRFVYYGRRESRGAGSIAFSWSDVIAMYEAWLNRFHVAKARELSHRVYLDQRVSATVQGDHNTVAVAGPNSTVTQTMSLSAIENDTEFSSEEFRTQLRDCLKLLLDVTENGETRQTQMLEEALREIRRIDLKTQTSLAAIVESLTPDQKSLLQRIREEVTTEKVVGALLKGPILSELVLNTPLI